MTAQIAPGAYEDRGNSGRQRRLVVGVDRSAGTELAVALAARLARDLNAGVVLAHGTMRGPGGAPTAEDLDRWRLTLVQAGVSDVRTVVDDDDPVRLLFRIAEEEDAYLIVLGPTRAGELREVIMGGVALELVHHGRRPVVIAATAHSEINPF